MVSTKLFVGNLPDNFDKDELDAMFKKFGVVVEFDILKDYGFVHYQKESEAAAAAAALDGHAHKGNNLRVEVSKSRVRQKAGMGGNGECYRCGTEGHWSKECPRGPTRPSRGGRGGGHRGGFNKDSERFAPYGRDPFFPPPHPYDYLARARALPPHPYDRYDRYRLAAYEARLAAAAAPRESLYRDFESRLPPAASRESMYRDFESRLPPASRDYLPASRDPAALRDYLPASRDPAALRDYLPASRDPAALRERAYSGLELDRPDPDYYRRPSPPRDPYYDFYARRRLAELDGYERKMRPTPAAGSYRPSPMPPAQRMAAAHSRVPGPY